MIRLPLTLGIHGYLGFMDNRLARAAMFRKYATQIRVEAGAITLPEALATAMEVARYWDFLAERMEKRAQDDPRA
jgi:hypothetical protein